MSATARSISRSVRETLRRQTFTARVLAAFDQACDLATPGGEVVTLRIGKGPLNLVVEAEAGELATALPGAPTQIDRDTLHVGELSVALGRAAVWEPRPNWSALRARQHVVTTGLPALRAIAQGQPTQHKAHSTAGID